MGENLKGRHSPRLNDKPEIVKAEIVKMFEKLDKKMDDLLSKNKEVLDSLKVNCENIARLQDENVKLKKEVATINEQMIRLDQYSRKDILIMTGVEYNESESDEELASKVTNILNRISGMSLNVRDFIAIHRNGRTIRNNRPPTVTVKFLRFTDKDVIFTRRSLINCRSMYSHVKLHHGLCPGLIDIRNKLAQVDKVKFARFDGGNRFFTVCVINGDDDVFFKRIQNVAQLEVEMAKLE